MKIDNLSLSFGIEEIFKSVNILVPDNKKVGIVGVNGAGKTTLFNLILGNIEPDSGKITLKKDITISYLPQVIKDDVINKNINVLDYLESGRPIKKLEKELIKCYNKLLDNTNDEKKIYKEIERIQNKLNELNEYGAESELLKIIDNMKIDLDMLDKKVGDLSGGEKSKIAFARVLYQNADIMLLDEPTNHLDENTRSYIINFLKNYKNSVYIISHDIPFLNEITNEILYINKASKTMELYNGNYDRFIKLHDEEEKSKLREEEKEEERVKELKGFIDKYSSASGKRKKMVKDREKKLKKILENKEEKAFKNKEVKLNINEDIDSAKEPLIVKDLCFKYNKDDKRYLIYNLSFSLKNGERFLIVGKNGKGKTTLLKLILGKLKPDKGEIIINKKTKIGYYAQEHETLDKNKTILENFNDIDISNKALRSYLGRFLFFGDDVYKKVGVLSPGERARVMLAHLTLINTNMLILDEPTNHLDPETQKLIASALNDYKGTILLVSHNVEFVDNLNIDRVLLIDTGKINFYNKDIVKHYEKINNKK